MWPHLIAKAKMGGLDVIQTYVFWNLHEPQHEHVRPYEIINEIKDVDFILYFIS